MVSLIKIADNNNISKTGNSEKSAKPNKLSMKEQQLKQYEEVAESYEAQFLQHMLGEMKKSVPQEEEDSTAMSFYNSTMDIFL